MLPKVRLVIAGPPTLPDDAQRLRRLVEVENVSNRVTLELRFLPPLRPGATRQRRVGGRLSSFRQGNSLGYCTMEALQAGKPV